nr:MAG TPA: hypothetical protein [Caudoviricetes sp.]
MLILIIIMHYLKSLVIIIYTLEAIVRYLQITKAKR